MKLQCPIDQNYFANVCMITQLFGNNKNVLFYGPKGHLGVDFETVGNLYFERVNQKCQDGKWTGSWKRRDSTKDERDGFIPLIASHEGYLTTNIYYRARQLGWGMFLNWKENNTEYRLLYWHIESPWCSLKTFVKRAVILFKPKIVRKGAVIAIAGNTGYPRSSTGPHLHWELQKKIGGQWVSEDPMPYLVDGNVIFQKGWFGERKWFYKGEEITQGEVDLIKNNLPKL